MRSVIEILKEIETKGGILEFGKTDKKQILKELLENFREEEIEIDDGSRFMSAGIIRNEEYIFTLFSRTEYYEGMDDFLGHVTTLQLEKGFEDLEEIFSPKSKIKKIRRVITHSGVFHSDEVFCVALFEKVLERELEVLRTRDGKDSIESFDGDITVDVHGGAYDHHIEEKINTEGHKLSSIGLIFQEFQTEIAEILKVKIDELSLLKNIINMIDNIDNGSKSEEILSFGQVIGMFNNSNIAKNDGNFRQAVNFSKTYLEKVFEEIKLQSSRNATWENKKNIGKVVCLDAFVPDWEVRAKKENLDVEFASTYEPWSSQYSIQRIISSVYDLKQMEGIEGVTFCHPAGFLLKTTTQDAVIEELNK